MALSPAVITLLAHFNKRMGMYIGEPSKGGVIAFLTGLECGTHLCGQDAGFVSAMSGWLTKTYGVTSDCLGWPGQIQRLADLRDVSWLEAYVVVSGEVLEWAGAGDTGPTTPTSAP